MKRLKNEKIVLKEDVLMGNSILNKQNKVTYCEKGVYHYNKLNNNSCTNKIRLEKINQSFKAWDTLETYFKDKKDLYKTLYSYQLVAKQQLLGFEMVTEWRNKYKLSNKYILLLMNESLKRRIALFMLAYKIRLPWKKKVS